MMFFQTVIADDIVINKRISLRSEVPWFLLWVVSSVFQTCQFILEIENVICLLVSEGSIFILGKDIDVIGIFLVSTFSFNGWVFVNLSYRIIPSLLGLDFATGHFNIWVCLALEVILFLNVCAYF